MRNEQIGDTHLPDYTGSEEDRFNDALWLLARMIAKDLLRKQSVSPQNASEPTKSDEGIADD